MITQRFCRCRETLVTSRSAAADRSPMHHTHTVTPCVCCSSVANFRAPLPPSLSSCIRDPLSRKRQVLCPSFRFPSPREKEKAWQGMERQQEPSGAPPADMEMRQSRRLVSVCPLDDEGLADRPKSWHLDHHTTTSTATTRREGKFDGERDDKTGCVACLCSHAGQ